MTGSVYEILTATGTGAVGVFCIAACVIGFIRGRLTILSRITIGIAGVSLLHQGLITDAIGAAIFAAIWFMNKKR